MNWGWHILPHLDLVTRDNIRDTPTSLQHIYLREFEKNEDTEKETTHVLTINNVNSFICVKSPIA